MTSATSLSHLTPAAFGVRPTLTSIGSFPPAISRSRSVSRSASKERPLLSEAGRLRQARLFRQRCPLLSYQIFFGRGATASRATLGLLSPTFSDRRTFSFRMIRLVILPRARCQSGLIRLVHSTFDMSGGAPFSNLETPDSFQKVYLRF